MKQQSKQPSLTPSDRARSTVTNRWLGKALHMGGLHTVSRLVSAWQKEHHR